MQTSALSFSSDEQKALYLKHMAEHCSSQFKRLQGKLLPIHKRMDKYFAELGGDFRHRQTGRATDIDVAGGVNSTVFERSNLSLSLTRGQVRYIVSKSFDEMFGSRPWLAVRPIGLQDADKARDLQKYVEHKLGTPGAMVEASVKDACVGAWGAGYGVLKTSYNRRVEVFDRVISAVIDPASGEPIQDREGKTITEEHPSHIEATSGGTVFNDDPEGRVFEEPTYESLTEPDVKVKYEGPELGCVHYGDFVADPDRPTLEECDFLGHHQAWTVGELKSQFGLGLIDPDTYEQIIQGAGIDRTKSARDSQGSKGRPASEQELWGKRENAEYINVVECYFNYERPTEDDGASAEEHSGTPVKMYALVAIESQEIIWADFLGNVTPEAEIPFSIVTSDKQPNSWVGVGFLQRFDQEQQFIDECINQIKVRNDYASNPIVVIDRKAFQEGDTGRPFEWGPGLHKELRGNNVAREAIEIMTLPQIEGETWRMMETVMQMVTQDSGVSGAAQGDLGTLPQMNTATGVKQVLGHGSILNKCAIREVQRGVEEAIGKLVRLMLMSMNATETIHFFEGNNEVEAIVNRQDFASLALDIRLNLTRFNQDEEQTRLAAVASTIERYLQIPPHAMDKVRPVFIDQLKTLGVEDAEERLPTVEDMMQFNAMMPGPPPPGEGGSPPPGGDEPPPPIAPMDQAEAAAESAEDMVRQAEQNA